MKMQKGFSLIEMLVVFGILMTFITIGTMNLFGLANKTFQNKTYTALASDIKAQQVKAMNGDTDGSYATTNYGIYFQSDKYTLFKGNNYSANDVYNHVITLPNDTKLSNITFTNSQIVFASGSGELINFSSSHNGLQILSTSNNTSKPFSINRFGVVTSN
jgi:prepilin-type N-terminal cleavage/methylation domain-containing protein